MLREHDPVDQLPGELGSVVAGDVVLGKRPLAARADVVLRVLAHLVEREDAEPRGVDDRLVDVGGVDPHAVGEVLLGEQDRQRVHLLTGGAPGHPEPREGVTAQERDDALAEGREERGVAEHRGHVDREVTQQPLHHGRVVEEQVLERRDRLDPLPGHPPADAPAERRRGVVAEVEPVAAVDSFQQQLKLDLLELELVASLYR